MSGEGETASSTRRNRKEDGILRGRKLLKYMEEIERERKIIRHNTLRDRALCIETTHTFFISLSGGSVYGGAKSTKKKVGPVSFRAGLLSSQEGVHLLIVEKKLEAGGRVPKRSCRAGSMRKGAIHKMGKIS